MDLISCCCPIGASTAASDSEHAHGGGVAWSAGHGGGHGRTNVYKVQFPKSTYDTSGAADAGSSQEFGTTGRMSSVVPPVQSWLIRNPMLQKPRLKKRKGAAGGDDDSDDDDTNATTAVQPIDEEEDLDSDSSSSDDDNDEDDADADAQNPDFRRHYNRRQPPCSAAQKRWRQQQADERMLRRKARIPTTRFTAEEVAAVMLGEGMLPEHLSTRQLRQVYSTEANGFSLKKLRQRCDMIWKRREQLSSSSSNSTGNSSSNGGGSGGSSTGNSIFSGGGGSSSGGGKGYWDEGCLLFIGTPSGARFGAFLSSLPQWGSSKYQGKGSTFLFKLSSSSSHQSQRPTTTDDADDNEDLNSKYSHDNSGGNSSRAVVATKFRGFVEEQGTGLGRSSSVGSSTNYGTSRKDRMKHKGNKYYVRTEDPWEGDPALSVGGGFCGGGEEDGELGTTSSGARGGGGTGGGHFPAIKLFRHGTRVSSAANCPTFFPDFFDQGPLFENNNSSHQQNQSSSTGTGTGTGTGNGTGTAVQPTATTLTTDSTSTESHVAESVVSFMELWEISPSDDNYQALKLKM